MGKDNIEGGRISREGKELKDRRVRKRGGGAARIGGAQMKEQKMG